MSSVGFVISARSQRAAQFIFPRHTRTELALRALETLVPRWVSNLDTRENLTLESDIDIKGPLTCPFIEDGNFGEDMYVAYGFFTSRRPREVDEDFLWATREIQHEVGIPENKTPKRHRVLPSNFDQQFAFIREHEDKVYDDVRQGAKALEAARNAKEI